MDKQENRAKSSDFLTKNYCPSCLQFKNIEKKISIVVAHKRQEYDLISSCLYRVESKDQRQLIPTGYWGGL